MKKILSAVAAFALAAALISCGGNSDEFDGKVDTVLTIGAPSVTAKAYPGVNYVTWSVVPSAVKYELYRIADGAASGTQLTIGNTDTAYADIATDSKIADGKTYKYVVVAVPGNAANTAANNPTQIPSRAIYMKANQGSASVKAYVPASGTEITAFTDSYTKNFLKNFDEKNLAKNVVITTAQDYTNPTYTSAADYWITYPATAGFKFAITTINPTQLAAGVTASDYASTIAGSSASWTTDYKENFKANQGKTALGAGKLEVYLTIASVSSFYRPISKKIGEVEFKAIGEKTPTASPKAYYTAANKAEIYWTPATLDATGKATGTANYTVYRSSAADGNVTFTKVEGTIVAKESKTAVDTTNNTPADKPTTHTVVDATKANTNNAKVSTVYAIEDTIADNTIEYKYYIVHKNGDLYGAYTTTGNQATLPVWENPTDKPTLTFNEVVSSDATHNKNVVMLTLQKAKAAQTLALSYAKIDKVAGKTTTLDTFASFTKIESIGNFAGDKLTNVVYFNADYDTDYIFKLTASEANKTDASVYVTLNVPAVSAGNVANLQLLAQAEPADAKDTKYAVVFKDTYTGAEKAADFEYTLYTVTTEVKAKDYDKYVTVTTSSGTKVTPEELTSGNKTKWGLAYAEKDMVGISEVSRVEREADTTKVTGYTSVRFYVVKQLKGKPETAKQTNLAGWTNDAHK